MPIQKMVKLSYTHDQLMLTPFTSQVKMLLVRLFSTREHMPTHTLLHASSTYRHVK